MALRNILTVEEPVLHKTARPVTRFDAHLGELLDDMRQTLTNAGGVGPCRRRRSASCAASS